MGVAIGTNIILPPCLTDMRSGDLRSSGDGSGEKPCPMHMGGGQRTISSGAGSGEKASIRPLWCPRTGSFNLLMRIGRVSDFFRRNEKRQDFLPQGRYRLWRQSVASHGIRISRRAQPSHGRFCDPRSGYH